MLGELSSGPREGVGLVGGWRGRFQDFLDGLLKPWLTAELHSELLDLLVFNFMARRCLLTLDDGAAAGDFPCQLRNIPLADVLVIAVV